MELATPALAAWVFLSFALPLGLYTVWSDLSQMKILNPVVTLLFAGYVITGPIVLELEAYLWRYSHFAVALLFGFVLNIAGGMGAGDAKFIAAAAPLTAVQDLFFVFLILTGMLFTTLITHRIFRATRLKNFAPDWKSWEPGNRFPMGFALAPTLLLYLVLCGLSG